MSPNPTFLLRGEGQLKDPAAYTGPLDYSLSLEGKGQGEGEILRAQNFDYTRETPPPFPPP